MQLLRRGGRREHIARHDLLGRGGITHGVMAGHSEYRALDKHLIVIGPARIVGASMGAFIAQELMVARPELVTAAVLMATRGRLDRARQFFHDAEAELYASGAQVPVSYDARARLLESFSRKTLNDDAAVDDWIAMFCTWPINQTPGLRCQLDVAPQTNRLPAYRSIAAPVLVSASPTTS